MIKKCTSCKGIGTKTSFSDGTVETCWKCNGNGFDCNGTNEIVCPYCGEEDSDSWEVNEGGFHECGYCEKNFMLEVNFSKDFSSSRADCLNDQSLHKLKTVHGYEHFERDGKVYRQCDDCGQYLWIPKDLDRPLAAADKGRE